MNWFEIKNILTEFSKKFAEKVSEIFAKKTDIPKMLPADGGNADTVNRHTVDANVPEDAKFTDTTYGVADETSSGLMSSDDYTKLKNIQSGAQVNKIENIEINGVPVQISGKTVNLEVLIAADLAAYYTAAQVDQKISAIPKFSIKAVDALPVTGISDTTVYLVKSGAESQNLYTEYIYVKGTWEKLGEQKVDLSDYVTKANAITGVKRKSNTVITFTRGDGTSFDITITGTTYSTMRGATASAAGAAGLVPAPPAGKQNAFLRGDGTWVGLDEMMEVMTVADIDAIIAGSFKG